MNALPKRGQVWRFQLVGNQREFVAELLDVSIKHWHLRPLNTTNRVLYRNDEIAPIKMEAE